MTPEEINQELREMLKRAIRELRIQNELQADQNELQAENIEIYRRFFNRTSFHIQRKPIAEFVEEEVKKEKERKKRFYPGHPGVPKRILDDSGQ